MRSGESAYVQSGLLCAQFSLRRATSLPGEDASRGVAVHSSSERRRRQYRPPRGPAVRPAVSDTVELGPRVSRGRRRGVHASERVGAHRSVVVPPDLPSDGRRSHPIHPNASRRGTVLRRRPIGPELPIPEASRGAVLAATARVSPILTSEATRRCVYSVSTVGRHWKPTFPAPDSRRVTTSTGPQLRIGGYFSRFRRSAQ